MDSPPEYSFGNHLIKNYIERSWGLYLMPKILGDDEGVIREVKENNLYGNALAVSKANRYTTNLLFEKKMSAVLKNFLLRWMMRWPKYLESQIKKRKERRVCYSKIR